MINRFTKEAKENRYTLHDYDIITEVPGDEEDMQQYANNKLGRHEDVEEELGIDLITFVKVLKAPEVYVKSHNEILEIPHCDISWDIVVNKISIVLEEDEKHTLYSIYHLKDYGKTWALTKEELE